jgi:hypothetical protein
MSAESVFLDKEEAKKGEKKALVKSMEAILQKEVRLRS